MEWSARQCGRWGGKEEKGGDGGRSGQVRSGQQSRIGDLVTFSGCGDIKKAAYACSEQTQLWSSRDKSNYLRTWLLYTHYTEYLLARQQDVYHYGRSVDYHQTITPFTCYPLLLLTPIDIPISDSSLDSSLVQFNNYYAVCITYLLHFHPLLH